MKMKGPQIFVAVIHTHDILREINKKDRIKNKGKIMPIYDFT